MFPYGLRSRFWMTDTIAESVFVVLSDGFWNVQVPNVPIYFYITLFVLSLTRTIHLLTCALRRGVCTTDFVLPSDCLQSDCVKARLPAMSVDF
jgi:hypothetical protein